MVHLTSTLHLIALALIANVARANPIPPPPTAPCEPTYGPFRLYSLTEERVTDLKVVTTAVDDGNTISKLSVSAIYFYIHYKISLTPQA